MRPVEAAGGVVLHENRVLLVHRPRYDDWTLPKGKLDRGESFEDAALREVLEETGLRCTLGRELPGTEYRDRKDRAKVVRYWLMAPDSEPGAFEPNDEVDEVRWMEFEEAAVQLTYDRDRDVLESVDPRRR